jgi:hypothetical protein
MTTLAVLYLAAVLSAPVGLVATAYELGGLRYVALISMENAAWNPAKVVREPRGHTSYGLAMIDDEWWPQYRGDVMRHLEQGAEILRGYGGDYAKYNGGPQPGRVAREWGRRVEARYQSLVGYLWRRMR